MGASFESPVHAEVAAADHSLAAAGHGQAAPSSSKHHGLLLLPPPSDDPKDPLRWPQWLKVAALLSTALANFTANFAGAGLSVASQVLAMQFQRSSNDINGLLSFNLLFLGVGNLVWVPLAVKFGKRFVLLTSMAMHFAVLIWAAKATSYESLLAARCLSGLAGGAGESLVPGIVSDIFFLHERAAMMAGYTIFASGATAVGPLLASVMLQYSPGGYVDFIWLSTALSGFNVLVMFLFFPDSTYRRPDDAHTPTALPDSAGSEKAEAEDIERASEIAQSAGAQESYVLPKKMTTVWTSFFAVDHTVSLFKVFLRPLVLLLCPEVLFATLLYGIALAAQIILIFAFPSLLLAPPYLFTPLQVGLIQIAAVIGFVLACFTGGYLADVITARMIRRQGRVVPEQRLVSIIPGCFIAPVGCIIVAIACSRQLSWVAIAFGFGMVSFGSVYAPNIAITYVVESRPKQASEAIVAINVFKNLVSFLFVYEAVTWVAARGWLEVYMIIFMLVTLSMVLAIPFYFFGSRLRAMSAWLERFL
ncbi:major facilitator superfamily domain-containing protein [Staphylotrichum tortipilum]|uniref:Major facilitator superfamily domain-containing protein n=1 Tax=Staphylotrichum tortipilum TaxID=2831512 RepID=A0AAN6RP88_9PEZI|nr:major facilitator superfamily domain-containing protein [Staphylotrichum longicolle]